MATQTGCRHRRVKRTSSEALAEFHMAEKERKRQKIIERMDVVDGMIDQLYPIAMQEPLASQPLAKRTKKSTSAFHHSLTKMYGLTKAFALPLLSESAPDALAPETLVFLNSADPEQSMKLFWYASGLQPDFAWPQIIHDKMLLAFHQE